MKFFDRILKSLLNPREGKVYDMKGMDQKHTCLNCGLEYNGKYCPRCGQKAQTAKLTPKNILNDAFSVFSFERKSFLGTITHLFYRPGHFIRDYLKGHRAPYYAPLSLLFLLCVIFALEVQIGIVKVRNREEKVKTALGKVLEDKPAANIDSTGWSWDWADAEESDADSLDETISFNDLAKDAVEVSLPDEISEGLKESGSFLDSSKRGKVVADLAVILSAARNWSDKNKALVIALLNISLAFVCWLLFRSAPEIGKLSYTEHFFIQIFISCQIMALTILVPPFFRLDDGSLSNWVLGILMVWDFKQLFQISWGKSLLKTILAGILNLIVMLLAFVVIAFLLGVILGIKNDAINIF